MTDWEVLVGLLLCCGTVGCSIDFDGAFSDPTSADAGLDTSQFNVKADATDEEMGRSDTQPDRAVTDVPIEPRLDHQAADSPAPVDAQDEVAVLDSTPEAPPDTAQNPSCTDECSGYCSTGQTSPDCDNCVECQDAEMRWEKDVQHHLLEMCWEQCTTDACGEECCAEIHSACVANKALQGCRCGYKHSSCEQQCVEACNGGGLSQSCKACVENSACAGVYYDYTSDPGSASMLNCRNSCDSGECLDQCCQDYPDLCALRQAMIACMCGGGGTP